MPPVGWKPSDRTRKLWSKANKRRLKDPKHRAKLIAYSKEGVRALQKLEALHPERKRNRFRKVSEARKRRMVEDPDFYKNVMAWAKRPKSKRTLRLLSKAATRQHRIEREELEKQEFIKCKGCGKEKPLKRFRYRYPGGRIVGIRKFCKLCYKKKQVLGCWGRNNPDTEFSFAEYQRLYAAQNGRCRICKQKEKKGRLLSLDHSHKTQEVRGLLCRNCNSGLGLFKDSVKRLKRAIKYLRGLI
jgi:hypothetical protein